MRSSRKLAQDTYSPRLLGSASQGTAPGLLHEHISNACRTLWPLCWTNFAPSQLYEVTFVQVSACHEYIHPWGVQLGNLSIVQPPTVSLNQIPSNGAYTASGNFNLTAVVFSVPGGTYSFTVYPTGILAPELNNTAIGNFHDWSGTITVTNSSVTVDMDCDELVLGT